MQHLLAGVRPQIGGHHVLGNLIVYDDLAGDGQAPLDAVERAEVRVAEAGPAVRGPGAANAVLDGYVVGQVAESDQKGVIVGGALIAKFGKYGKLQHRLGPDQTPAQERDAGLDHVVVRALAPVFLLGAAMAIAGGLDALLAVPGERHRLEQRMQGGKGDMRPEQRDAGGMQAVAAAVDQSLHVRVAEGL